MLKLNLWLACLFLLATTIQGAFDQATITNFDFNLWKEFETKPEIQAFANPTSFRLPNNTTPIHYSLALRTNVHRGNLSYTGTVRIHIKVLEPSSTITLHAGSLIRILNVSLYNTNRSSIQSSVPFERIGPVYDFLIIKAASELEVDQVLIADIRFSANLRTDSVGFFRAATVVDNSVVLLASSNFKPVLARLAFPCYDEIRYRTSFEIQIQHHRSLHAVSNMPIASVQGVDASDGFVTTYFETTPSMPVYLVSFTVSNFDFVTNKDPNLEMRVYAQSDAISNHQADVAIEISQTMLRAMEKFVNIPYPLPKADQIAVPESWETVEGWGLITMPESIALLLNNDSWTQNYRESEIARQFAVSF